MNNNYLWDGSGEPDPEVERLECLLGTLRSVRPAPELPARAGWFRFSAAAAAAVLIATAVWISARGTSPSWELTRVGPDRTRTVGRLGVGESLETGSHSRAELSIARVGVVEIEPNTRLRLVKAQVREHRIALERGAIRASIWAPPRLFFVETPSAVAVDLGCSYTLEVDEKGSGLLRVITGWVGFERDGRESFIPTGAECRTRPGIGPGTPYFPDASPALRDALVRLDFENGGPGDLDIVLAESRKGDFLTLWHLLERADGGQRESVYQRMAQFAPPPAGVTAAGVLRGDRRMLHSWWNDLGRWDDLRLGETSFWQLWKEPD